VDALLPRLRALARDVIIVGVITHRLWYLNHIQASGPCADLWRYARRTAFQLENMPVRGSLGVCRKHIIPIAQQMQAHHEVWCLTKRKMNVYQYL
jgi:hypothetical protein